MGRTTLVTTVALAAAFVAPATAAALPYEEWRSAGTVDAAEAAAPPPSSIAAGESRSYQDLRSPDARDAAHASESSSYQDLRSPDARDVGRVPVQVPEPVVEIRPVAGDGFDWGDAGIGAGGALALLSITGGLALMVGARRRRGFHVPAH